MTTTRSDYTAALIERDLYLLGAVFSSIEEQNINMLKTDIMSHTGVNLTTIQQLYHITETDVDKLHSYEKEHREELYKYLAESIVRHRELRELVKKYNVEYSKAQYSKVLGIILLISAIVYLFTITFYVIPPENVQLVNTIGGMVIGCTVQSLMGYFFPRNSSNKNNQ
jgi:Fe2+ transport system protein B